MALFLFAALAPGLAGAVEATGTVTIKPQPGKATSDLFKQGAKLVPTGKGKAVTLDVADLTDNKVTTTGTLTVTKGKRKAVLRGVTANVNTKGVAIAGKLGDSNVVVFRATGKWKADDTSVKLNGADVSLTAKGAKSLRGKLGLKSLKAGKIGKLNLSATKKAVTPTPDPPKPDPKPDPEPEVDPYPYAASCPVATVAGNPGFGDEPGTIESTLPAPTFNAGTSQPLTGTSIKTGFLANFRNYVLNAPPAGTLQTFDGATPSAAGAGMSFLDAFFDFPVSSGTYERGTESDHSDDKLVANGSGTVLFCKTGHGFSVALKNPTITIDGANSRLTYDAGANYNGTWYPFQRVDLATLDLSGIEPSIADSGNTMAWEDIPATLTADGSSALGGIYDAGDLLDKVTVETALDRPLLAECGVEAGLAAPPAAVDFALDPQPTLTSPVVRSGKNLGTINWGFRRSTRNSVAGGGSFPLLAGATAAFPENMGGGASNPPTGGEGKFFRFPISEYQYEAGTASLTDDRLIATSNATVGLCKPNTAQGNFGLIISKPTLIVDGANSRLVANAYSFSGTFMTSPTGWMGGRVDLVNLDTSAGTSTGTGTVRWGEVNSDFEPLLNGITVNGALQTNALTLANLTPAATGSNWDKLAAQIVLP